MYTANPVEVEAVQMPNVRLAGAGNDIISDVPFGDWPDWLLEAWNKTEGVVGSISIGSRACCGMVYVEDGVPHLPKGAIVLCVHGGRVRVRPGDWIVRDASGELSLCPAAKFAERYTLVGG